MTTTRCIVNAFSTFLRLKYSPLLVDEGSIRYMLEVGVSRLSAEWRDTLDIPLTSDELTAAITKGDAKNATGRDGIGLILFQATSDVLKDDWLDLFSQMIAPGNLTEQQKRGEVVCITKTTRSNQPPDYRPTALLKTDYKILARIMANRNRPATDLLHPTQFCGRPGNTIFEAIASVRKAIAFAEVKTKPSCILTLDFLKKLSIEYPTYIC